MDRHSITEQPPRGAGAVAVHGVFGRFTAPDVADVARIVTATAARVILLTTLCLLGWAAAPAALGWTPTTVMTGSMEPRIHPGDVVVARPLPVTSLAVGQIVLVDDPDHAGRLRLHRYVAAAPGGDLVLRGDANRNDDSTPVHSSAVHGVGFIRVPYVGMPVLWLAERRMVALGLFTGAVMLLVGATRLDRRQRSAAAADAAREDTEGPKPVTRRRVVLVVGAGLAVLTAAGLVGVHAAAGASFTSPSTNPQSSLSAQAGFSCLDATVSDSPYLLYRFNEASGTNATDASSNARTGALNGSTTRVAGSCATGDSPALTLGSNGYVSTPTQVSAAPTTMSMETWFRTSTATGGGLMDFGSAKTGSSTSTDRILYLTNAGKVTFGVYASFIAEQVVTSPSSYNDGGWHHVVATLSGTTMNLYLDGTRVATGSSTFGARTNAGYWRIGQDAIASSWPSAPSSSSFEGTVDDAAVYTTVLSSTRITAHYAAGR